jgi:hypothetical protein
MGFFSKAYRPRSMAGWKSKSNPLGETHPCPRKSRRASAEFGRGRRQRFTRPEIFGPVEKIGKNQGTLNRVSWRKAFLPGENGDIQRAPKQRQGLQAAFEAGACDSPPFFQALDLHPSTLARMRARQPERPCHDVAWASSLQGGKGPACPRHPHPPCRHRSARGSGGSASKPSPAGNESQQPIGFL